MNTRLTCITAFVFVLVFGLSTADDSDRRLSSSEARSRSIRVMCHYGNLFGVGIGAGFKLGPILEIQATGGIEAPASAIWAVPFTGNTANGSLRILAGHRSGFYTGVGTYAGHFEISRGIESPEKIEYWVFAPLVNFGFIWPKSSTGVKLAMELGMCLFLPKRLINETPYEGALSSYCIYAERSHARLGVFYPFYSFYIIF